MVSEQGMEKPRLKSLETEVSSLAASEERMVKEMQEMFSAMNVRLDPMSSSRAREQGQCSYNAAHNSGGKRNTSGGGSQEIFFNSHLPRTIKLDFTCFNGSDDPTRAN